MVIFDAESMQDLNPKVEVPTKDMCLTSYRREFYDTT